MYAMSLATADCVLITGDPKVEYQAAIAGLSVILCRPHPRDDQRIALGCCQFLPKTPGLVQKTWSDQLPEKVSLSLD